MQFNLFFERYRFILLNGQRDDRRHISRDRMLLQQLQAYVMELQGSSNSVLMSRTIALIHALIVVVEQRIRACGRNIADAYLGDVMHME